MKLTMSLIVLGCVLTTTAMVADPPRRPKEPWEWTDAERIAALSDPAAAAARLAAHRERMQTDGMSDERSDGLAAGFADPIDVINGKRDPHLYFTWELFDWLVAICYVDDPHTRETFRAIKEREAKRTVGGLPPDFWERLDAISAAYRGDLQRERQAPSIPDAATRNAEMKAVAALLCHDRHTAFQEAKQEFGPWFERFLYKVIAPGKSAFVLEKTDPQIKMHVGRGCR